METRASFLWPATSSAKPNFGGGDSPETAHTEQGLGRILWNMGMRPFLSAGLMWIAAYKSALEIFRL